MKDRYTSVEEQNAVMDELLSALAERDARIAELERASAELQSAQKAVQLAAKVTLASLRVHALLLLRPKLGVLRQYAPFLGIATAVQLQATLGQGSAHARGGPVEVLRNL